MMKIRRGRISRLTCNHFSYRHDKQLKELSDKGYFIMADGTKSSDHQVSGKKKKAQRSEKESKKRSSAVNKSMRSEKSGAKGKKAAAKTKQSEDDLDIESGEESAQESD
jgi:hypothetical protein